MVVLAVNICPNLYGYSYRFLIGTYVATPSIEVMVRYATVTNPIGIRVLGVYDLTTVGMQNLT
ncbi:MAG: hypothetical protein Fur006_55900 [Coleofasciculaceae cyanobacterium]